MVGTICKHFDSFIISSRLKIERFRNRIWKKAERICVAVANRSILTVSLTISKKVSHLDMHLYNAV